MAAFLAPPPFFLITRTSLAPHSLYLSLLAKCLNCQMHDKMRRKYSGKGDCIAAEYFANRLFVDVLHALLLLLLLSAYCLCNSWIGAQHDRLSHPIHFGDNARVFFSQQPLHISNTIGCDIFLVVFIAVLTPMIALYLDVYDSMGLGTFNNDNIMKFIFFPPGSATEKVCDRIVAPI